MGRSNALWGALLLACSRDFPPTQSYDAGSASEDAGATLLREAAMSCEAEDLRGGELVVVPAGGVLIGATDLTVDSLPLTWTDFEEFRIDRTEVTIASYRQCVEAGVCITPNIEEKPSCNWSIEGTDDHPVNCIDHARAQTYCAWAGKRLPTEREWEYAARGNEGRRFPWGADEPGANLLNWNELVGTTTAVGSYPVGATPDTGLLDMSGNVWEWTASEWCYSHAANASCDPSRHVARGGSWASIDRRYVRPAWRDSESDGSNRFGIRCACGAGEVR
jgi:formylglycine-generating enzyme required for sulfatase activity